MESNNKVKAHIQFAPKTQMKKFQIFGLIPYFKLFCQLFNEAGRLPILAALLLIGLATTTGFNLRSSQRTYAWLREKYF